MLMVHTAGLGYDFFSHTYNHLAQEKGQPSVITSSKASLITPLLFDPGNEWEYGTNLDWCGQIVEAITGKRLGDVFKARIFEPLGMNDTSFDLTDAMRSKLAGVHARGPDGSLTPMDFELPPILKFTWAAMAFTPLSATTCASFACGLTMVRATMAGC